MAVGSRADVGQPGSGLRVEARLDADNLARHERAKARLRATAEEGLQAAVESRGAAPGQGAAPWAPSPESQADVARVDGPADWLEDTFGGEWRWWDHRDRWQARFTRVCQADGATSGFQGPELQNDAGELAIWAMGADRAAITKQEAALTMLRTMRAQCQAAGVGFQGTAQGSGAELQAPTIQSRADVARTDTIADGGTDWGSDWRRAAAGWRCMEALSEGR